MQPQRTRNVLHLALGCCNGPRCAGAGHELARRAAGRAGDGGRGGGAAGQRRVRRARAVAGGRALAVLRRQAAAAQPAPRRALQAPRAALRQQPRHRRQGATIYCVVLSQVHLVCVFFVYCCAHLCIN